MAVVPAKGRAAGVADAPPEADLTRALYERHAGQIFRYCLHQLGSREEAEDAVQSTFLNAFRGLKRGVVPEIESAWLFKIAHNVCLSRRRSSWRRERIESPADFDVVEELAPAPARREDELIGLQDALGQMPEQQRRAILLREWQGLSYREIADELDVSQAAVETLIFRARRSLAQGLERPAEPRRRRLGAGLLGNLLSSAQSFLLGGGGAVKVAAVVAAAGAGTVVATAPIRDHAPPSRAPAPPQQPARHAARPTAHHVERAVRTPVAAAPVPVAPVRRRPVERPAPTRHAVHRKAHAVAPPPHSTGQSTGHATGRATAPGQVKKAAAPVAASGTPPATRQAATGKGHAVPPGRAKQPAVAPAEPPGQAKKAAAAPVEPPGRAKKTEAAPAAAPPTPSAPGNSGNGGKGPK